MRRPFKLNTEGAQKAPSTPSYLVATLGAYISLQITIGICTALWLFWAIAAVDRESCE